MDNEKSIKIQALPNDVLWNWMDLSFSPKPALASQYCRAEMGVLYFSELLLKRPVQSSHNTEK